MGTGIPLAWLQLTHEKRRLMAALIGISFAVVLMLTQLGFQDALFASVSKMHRSFVGDLFLISPNYQNMVTTSSFSERRLYQALASASVDSVYPMYLDSAYFKNPVTKKVVTVYAIGFKPTVSLLDIPELADQLPQIRKVGNVLFDSIRRPEFGPVSEMFERDGKLATEINGKRVDVMGLFELGVSFASDGHVVMSDETFQRILNYEPGIINAGLIRLKPGADLLRTRAELSALLPPDVEVLTKEEFVDRELQYWSTATPIGFVFGLGVLVGIFIGCIIVYQILYTDVTNHLPEYATLKALGYGDMYLVGIVLKEALILSVMGFFPGVLVSHFVYLAAHDATQLPMVMTTPRTLAVYLLTVGMCTVSALFAVRRLKSADPAEIF